MKSNTLILSFAGVILLGLSGCARYQAQSLKRLSTDTSNQITNNSISYASRAFDRCDCKRYLDRNVIEQGYQPVHLTITNNTDRNLNFLLEGISMPCLDAQEVAQKVHTSTLARAASYGVAGLFIWPLLIPAVVDGIGSSQANEKLDSDFERKAMRNQTIMPYNTINGLVFVSSASYDPNFRITLTDIQTSEQFILSKKQTCIKL